MTEQGPSQSRSARGQETSGTAVGFILFAAIMMIMVGVFQGLQGIIAIFENEFYVATRNYLFQFDATTWGWIHLILGLLVAFAGYGLLSGRTWARVVAITLAVFSAITNSARGRRPGKGLDSMVLARESGNYDAAAGKAPLGQQEPRRSGQALGRRGPHRTRRRAELDAPRRPRWVDAMTSAGPVVRPISESQPPGYWGSGTWLWSLPRCRSASSSSTSLCSSAVPPWTLRAPVPFRTVWGMCRIGGSRST
jgi:hypothetical protein